MKKIFIYLLPFLIIAPLLALLNNYYFQDFIIEETGWYYGKYYLPYPIYSSHSLVPAFSGYDYRIYYDGVINNILYWVVVYFLFIRYLHGKKMNLKTVTVPSFVVVVVTLIYALLMMAIKVYTTIYFFN